MAANRRRSRCDFWHGFPVLSVHLSRGLARHTGQRTASICLGVSFSGTTIVLSDLAGFQGMPISAGCHGIPRSFQPQISKSAMTTLVCWRQRSWSRGMRFGRMLIHRFCRLRATVAIRAVEIQCADAMSAGNALERDAPVHRFGRVISHTAIVAAYSSGSCGHWVCNLRVPGVPHPGGPVGGGRTGTTVRQTYF